MMTSMFKYSFSNKQFGAAMVEFALILPILIVLVFGITELGRAIYQQNTLSKAIASGVRFISRYEDAALVSSSSGICGGGAAFSEASEYATNLVVTGQESGGGTPLLPGLGAGNVTFFIRPSADCVVQGSVAVPFRSLFGSSIVPLLNLGEFDLTAESEERYHGE